MLASSDNKSQFDLFPMRLKASRGRQLSSQVRGDSHRSPPVRHMLASEASDELYEELMTFLVEQPLIIMETPMQAGLCRNENTHGFVYCTKDVSVPQVHFWACSRHGE